MYFNQLAIDASKMTKGELSAITTFSGVAIVFGMLLILVIMIAVFGLFAKVGNGKSGKKAKPEKAPKVKKVAEPSPSKSAVNTLSNVDDDEVIAVISAAVFISSIFTRGGYPRRSTKLKSAAPSIFIRGRFPKRRSLSLIRIYKNRITRFYRKL